ncbi:MAG: 3'-5' exonuclease [Myxococcales bacterium]|nr:3'-5' exonuclease [Myxococcales bacterium]
MSEPNILIFDVETTGTDKKRDQVIELCAQFGLDETAESRTWRIRPSIEIQPGAQEVHGISMDDLKDAPTFAAVADELRALFTDVQMLVGYNLRFDIDMLQAEFQRLRLPPIDLSDTYVVDPFRLWQRREPRSLMDAHKRFVGSEFEAAHSASADVAATGRVLLGMVESFGLGSNWEEVADICEPERANWIGGTHHLQWDESGSALVAFGKHSGAQLSVLAAGADAGYLRWLVGSDFPQHVREICSKALEGGAADLISWLAEAYPRRFAKTPEATASDAKSSDDADAPSKTKAGQQSLF